MKAIDKTTGKIIDVTPAFGGYFVSNGELIPQGDLDFNLENQYPGTTISGWVARDDGGGLYLHSIRPRKGAMEWHGDRQPITLPIDSFPSLTWQDEPIEVEIQIKPKKQ